MVDKYYEELDVKRILIHPSNKETSAAFFTHDVEVMMEADLKRFVKRVREFFKSFEALKFSDFSITHTQELVNIHGLSIPSLLKDYSRAQTP